MWKKMQGFTLTEMVVAMLILAILAITAIESYTTYVRKARRADAVNSLISMSLAEERYRSSNTTYGTLAQVWGGVSTSTEGFYTLSISNVSASGYTITATATGAQANDVEGSTSCSTMTLTVNNGTITRSPSACWPG